MQLLIHIIDSRLFMAIYIGNFLIATAHLNASDVRPTIDAESTVRVVDKVLESFSLE